VLFILFLWLNSALAQGIESIGREIQEKSEELDVLKRRETDLLREISIASSEQKLADEAWALGYRPQTPVYLQVAQPLAEATNDVEGSGWRLTSSANGGPPRAYSSHSLWDIVARPSYDLRSRTAP
jgi:hypothetical protein